MFTEHELSFIREVIGIQFDPQNATDDEWIELEDKVGSKLIMTGLDANYDANEVGIMCESILSKIE